MQKNPSVMNNLHKISDKIAVSVRTPANTENTENTEPAEKKKNNSNFTASSEQLERRYEEYLRARRDLEERIISLYSKFAEEEQQHTDRIGKLRNAQNDLATILEAVPEPEDHKFMFNDRAEAANMMRNVEVRRLEAMRVIASTELNNKSQDNGGSAEKTIMLLDSLSFRQIFRIAFASALPFLFWTLLGALIVSFAVIGSWKGWF